MALTEGINSFISLEYAESYFEDRLDVAAWTEANETQQAQAIVTATAILDMKEWPGVALSASQPLSFPRKGSYFDPRLGYQIVLDETVPKRIQNATCELAYHLLNNDGLLDDTGGVLELQLGSISLKHISNPSELPAHVHRMIRPVLVNSGSRAWWRSN